jgi:hypothetical protein
VVGKRLGAGAHRPVVSVDEAEEVWWGCVSKGLSAWFIIGAVLTHANLVLVIVSAVFLAAAGVMEEGVWVCYIEPLVLWVEVVEGVGGVGVTVAEAVEECSQ